MKRITILAIAALVAFAAIGVYAITASGSTSGATVNVRSTSLGRVLVDAKGRTLYLFAKDTHGRSSCSGACAMNWPPLTAAKPKAGSGVRKAELGTTKRADGGTQVTYNGHPLYRFVGDTKAGATTGEGLSAFGARWYAVNAAGNRVTKSASSPAAPAPPSPYGY